MTLAKADILAAIKAGDLEIDPFVPGQIGAASFDLRLDRYFRRLKPSLDPLVLNSDVDYRMRDVSEFLELDEGEHYVLQPGQTVLGITMERLHLGPGLSGRLEGRSRFARLGLLIHISAGFVSPGTNNQQVLEISNMSPRPLALVPGVPICQCIFERTTSPARHTGRYKTQDVAHFRETLD